MKRDEIKAHRAAKKVAAAKLLPTPINPDFISIAELLARLQTAPAEPPVTLTDAAEWLLFNWCAAEHPPAWKCNGKLGIVPIDSFAEKHEIPLKRLDYVFHREHFESDGPDSGASTDYEYFGFNREELAAFMALLGEPLNLFCPMPETQADTAPEQNTATPAPVVAATASGVIHSTKARRDTLTPVIELAQNQCRNPQDTAEVWAVLLMLAEKKHPPLIGATEDGLQYLNKGSADIFTKKSLGQRLAR